MLYIISAGCAFASNVCITIFLTTSNLPYLGLKPASGSVQTGMFNTYVYLWLHISNITVLCMYT